MANHLLWLSGYPASGKSHFGRWLETEKHFVHIDLEKNDTGALIKSLDLVDSLNACFATGNCVRFCNELHKKKRSFVWSWGFPPTSEALDIVKALKKVNNGFNMWWFDATPEASAIAFQARQKRGEPHGATLHDLGVQLGALSHARSRIKGIFLPNMLVTLTDEGTPKYTCQQLFDIIVRKQRPR